MEKEKIYWKDALEQLSKNKEITLSKIDFKHELISLPNSLRFKELGVNIPNKQVDFDYDVLGYSEENDQISVQILSTREIDYWDEIERGVFVAYDEKGQAAMIEIKQIHDKIYQFIKEKVTEE